MECRTSLHTSSFTRDWSSSSGEWCDTPAQIAADVDLAAAVAKAADGDSTRAYPITGSRRDVFPGARDTKKPLSDMH